MCQASGSASTERVVSGLGIATELVPNLALAALKLGEEVPRFEGCA